MLTTGEVIKIFRKNHGMSQDELGEILGVKKSAIQKYESGSVQNLKIETIRRLCETFRIPPWILIFSDGVSEDFLSHKKESGESIGSFFELLDQLNNNGRIQALRYLEDLSLIAKYTDKTMNDNEKPCGNKKTPL